MSPLLEDAPDTAPAPEAANVEAAPTEKRWKRERRHITELLPNPLNPREQFDDIAELAANIREYGLKDLPTARRIRQGPLRPDLLEAIDGGGRRRLALLYNLEQYGYAVTEGDSGLFDVQIAQWEVSDLEMVQLAIDADQHHDGFKVLERANAYAALERLGMTQIKIAQRYKSTQPAVSNLIRLLALPPIVKEAISAGNLSQSHGGALLALPTSEDRVKFALQAMEGKLSVSALATLVKQYNDEESAKSSPPLPGAEEEAPPAQAESSADVAEQEPPQTPPALPEAAQPDPQESESKEGNNSGAAALPPAPAAVAEESDPPAQDEGEPAPEQETPPEEVSSEALEPKEQDEPTQTEDIPETPPAPEETPAPAPAPTPIEEKKTVTAPSGPPVVAMIPAQESAFIKARGVTAGTALTYVHRLFEIAEGNTTLTAILEADGMTGVLDHIETLLPQS